MEFLSGFLQGLLLAVVVVQMLVILFLVWYALPILGDVTEFVDGLTDRRKGGARNMGRKVESLTSNPIIGTAIDLFRGAGGQGSSLHSPQSPAPVRGNWLRR